VSWWNPFDWAEWFSDKVSWAFDKVGDGLDSAFDTVGLDFAGDAANWVSDRIGEKIEGMLDRSADYIKSLPDNLGRTADDLFSEEIYTNFGKWLGRNVLNSLELAGLPKMAETIADFVKFETRPLDDREMALARSVFGDSINLDLVRIDNYSAFPYFTGRAYTTFHTINTWGDLDDNTLIHELTHVWQFENVGADYIPGAIDDQVWGDGYDYGGVGTLTYGISQGWRLESFNYEQQGQILQDYYKLIETGIATGYYSQDLAIYAYYVKHASTLSQNELSRLTVGTGDDTVVGDEWSNYLAGYDGNDRVYGGVGDDYLVGGNGNDLLDGGLGYDVATYNSDDYNYQVSFDYYGNVIVTGVEGTDSLQGIEQINFANYGAYKIYTGNGNDNTLIADYWYTSLLHGGGGNDFLMGGIGNDTIVGGDGYDIAGYYGEYYNYNVSFNSNGDLVVVGAEGTDSLQGIEQINFANYGAYKIYTGDGNDLDNYIYGSVADNSLDGRSGNDTIDGGDGNDKLDGGKNNDILSGDAGNDTLKGSSGNDRLYGGDGDDTLSGDSDDDILNGGAGNDLLKGGTGADRFQFTSVADGIDIIEDFNLAEGDKIEIIQTSFGATSASQFSYDRDSGVLFYDASPADDIDAIQLGTIENKPVGFSVSQDLIFV
jgi:Ca2+-binding RTX toxin-like protein